MFGIIENGCMVKICSMVQSIPNEKPFCKEVLIILLSQRYFSTRLARIS